MPRSGRPPAGRRRRYAGAVQALCPRPLHMSAVLASAVVRTSIRGLTRQLQPYRPPSNKPAIIPSGTISFNTDREITFFNGAGGLVLPPPAGPSFYIAATTAARRTLSDVTKQSADAVAHRDVIKPPAEAAPPASCSLPHNDGKLARRRMRKLPLLCSGPVPQV